MLTGSTTVVTETRARGGTVITETYGDGKVKSVTGSAVADVEYEYGIDTVGEFTKEIRLSATGGRDEWVKTWKDGNGDTVREERPIRAGRRCGRGNTRRAG